MSHTVFSLKEMLEVRAATEWKLKNLSEVGALRMVAKTARHLEMKVELIECRK
jgi:hypothetical protein